MVGTYTPGPSRRTETGPAGAVAKQAGILSAPCIYGDREADLALGLPCFIRAGLFFPPGNHDLAQALAPVARPLIENSIPSLEFPSDRVGRY